MKINEFVKLILKVNKKITEDQIRNIEGIIKVSKEFHKKAETYDYVAELFDNDVNENTIVLEAAHQPNFVPYSGVWRKAYLLHFFYNEMPNSIPLFGFFDYNLATASLLTHNKIPDIRKEGFTVIGVRIPEKDKWKRFNSLPKPSKNAWENVIRTIENVYIKVLSRNKDARLNLDLIIEELWKSYELGSSLSEINAIFFSRLTNIYLGLKVLFFKYSNLHDLGVLKDAFERVIYRRDEFNNIYNETVVSKGLSDVGTIPDNLAPFWYHCKCGGKVDVFIKNSKLNGVCPICKTEYELDVGDIDSYYVNISPRAVTRNIVMADGIGTRLYISGAGGGLRYGIIANEISRRLGFNLPFTLAWVGKDHYLGLTHTLMLKRLRKMLGISDADLLNLEKVLDRIRTKRIELKNKIDKNYSKKLIHDYKHTYAQILIACNVFKVTPSVIDIFLSKGFSKVLKCWNFAVHSAEISFEDEFYILRKNIVYDDRAIAIYDVMNAISIKNKEIDPLGILGGE